MKVNGSYKPPRVAELLLGWLLPEDGLQTPSGDFEEFYNEIARERGEARARMWYWLQALRLIPDRLSEKTYWGTVMFKNQLKSVFRTLRSQSGYAALNIGGLSVGIALSILALLYVQHEYSFDKGLSKGDRIYRVVQVITETSEFSSARSGPGLAEKLLENFPEVIQATRISSGTEFSLQYGGNRFEVENWYSSDPSVFDLLDIEILHGNAAEPLPDHASFVISETAAKKLFGEDDPVGKIVTLTGPWLESSDMTVTAVARDMPANSHFRFDYLDWIEPKDLWSTRVAGYSHFTYVVLPEDYPPERLEEKFPAFVDRVIDPATDGYPRSLQEMKDAGGGWALHLQRVEDIHLDSRYEGAFGRKGSRSSMSFFSIIALFILVLACVNFMNLATARSSRRIKEVGVRKVMGSSRTQLIHRFLLESVILSLLSLLVACGLVALLLPAFNTFLGTEVTFDLFENAYLLPGLIILALSVGVLAGSYPAFFLSAFRPVELFSGARRTGARGVSLRDGLVVFQFLITVLLIVATIVVHSQLSFMRNKDLGFDGEQILVLQNVESAFARTEAGSKRGLLEESGSSWEEWQAMSRSQRGDMIEDSEGALGYLWPMTRNRIRVFKERLLGIPGVQSTSLSRTAPGRTHMGAVRVAMGRIDADFVETLQLQLVAGRNLSDNDPMGSFLINEAAADLFGSENVIGSTVRDQFVKLGIRVDSGGDGQVVGVVKDFQYADMHTEVKAALFWLQPANNVSSPHILVRLQAGDVQAALASIESTWSQFIPDEALKYSFLDEDFARLFEAEDRLGKAFGFFATLAIIIACLGLFGLAAFTAEQRTKEIGIRKTLGASVESIVQLLSKHFLWLLLIGNLVAWPIGYIAMNRWLDTFAFRIEIGVGIFALTGALALVLVVISVGGQALRASLANPVDSIRYE
jgi:putative ABC transport system permease protein